MRLDILKARIDMQTKEQIQRTYDEAVFTRDSRKEEVTVDMIDVEAEFVIKILGKVLGVHSE